MATRDAISNLFITVVVLFFMVLLAMLLKGRYRLPSERKAAVTAAVPKAEPIPVAKVVPKEEPRESVSQRGDFTVLNNPTLVVSRGNEPDTLRIKSGAKEEVYVLYFVSAVQTSWNHPKRINDTAAYFGHATTQHALECGSEALSYVVQLLTHHAFKVYTKGGRVPETERFYAFISVELEPGKFSDLGELLVRKGYASPEGQKTSPLPYPKTKLADYTKELQKAMQLARNEHAGLWAHATE